MSSVQEENAGSILVGVAGNFRIEVTEDNRVALKIYTSGDSITTAYFALVTTDRKRVAITAAGIYSDFAHAIGAEVSLSEEFANELKGALTSGGTHEQ